MAMKSSPPSDQTASDLNARFRRLSARVAEILGTPSALEPQGIRVLPFRSPELPHFTKLPEAQQRLGVTYLESTLGFLESLVAMGKPVHDSPQFVWRALNALGFVPSSGIFDKITQEDIIEIYTGELRQLFRNLTFFKFVSLTLEELLSVPVTELIDFSPGLETQLLRAGLTFQNPDITEPFDPNISPYDWAENWGERRKGRTQVKWMAPVRRAGGEYVVLVVNRTENL